MLAHTCVFLEWSNLLSSELARLYVLRFNPGNLAVDVLAKLAR